MVTKIAVQVERRFLAGDYNDVLKAGSGLGEKKGQKQETSD